MAAQDIFVGLAAGAIGCFFLLGALLNAPWLMNLTKPRALTDSVGRTAACWILAALGVAVILMGALIASGWRIHWS